MTSFTDQKQRVCTPEDVARRYGPGGRLRCTLCGHFMLPGDKWRWVSATSQGVTNPTVCGDCDGENQDVIDRWKERIAEFKSAKFWALRETL